MRLFGNSFKMTLLLLSTACGGDEVLARAQKAIDVSRLPTGVRSDSVFALMSNQVIVFDKSTASKQGPVRMVEWRNGLQVTFLNDTLTQAKILDLSK